MFLIPSISWEVRKISKKGKGVFAKKEIPPGTLIGDYLGKIYNTKDIDTEASKFYDMEWDETYSIIPDSRVLDIHLINHSCVPNCAMYPYKGHTLYFALRRIFSGEELTIMYMIGTPENETKSCKDTCYCKSLLCRGTMHNPRIYNKRYNKLENINSSDYMKRLPVPVGSMLPQLRKYPKVIEDFSLYDIFGSNIKKPHQLNVSNMLSVSQLRKLIREKGRQISIPALRINIYGIMNGLIVCASLK